MESIVATLRQLMKILGSPISPQKKQPHSIVKQMQKRSCVLLSDPYLCELEA